MSIIKLLTKLGNTPGVFITLRVIGSLIKWFKYVRSDETVQNVRGIRRQKRETFIRSRKTDWLCENTECDAENCDLSVSTNGRCPLGYKVYHPDDSALKKPDQKEEPRERPHAVQGEAGLVFDEPDPMELYTIDEQARREKHDNP